MLYIRMRTICLLVPAACLLFLTGCWSRIEVNERVFVTGLYVDRADNGSIEASVGFPLPHRMQSGGSQNAGGGASGGGLPYALITKAGENLSVAIRRLRSDLTREISWGHCRVIIIGKKMAESGIGPILEFAAREPNFHTKSYVMVAPGKATDIARLTPVLEQMPTEVLRQFAKRRVTLDTSVRDFLEAASVGGDIAAAMLTIKQLKMLSEKEKQSTWVGTNGAALFKNAKMVGTLDVKDMRVGLWLKGVMKNAVISVKSPTDGKPISFMILTSKTTIKPVVERDQIRFNIRIEADDDVLASESDIDLTDPKQIDRLENLLSKQLRERVISGIEKTQSIGADVFQFGRYIEWNYPKVWKEQQNRWHSTYQNIEFDVSCKIYVRRTGVEKNPFQRLKHQNG